MTMWPTTSERDTLAPNDRLTADPTAPDPALEAHHTHGGAHGAQGEMEPGWKHWGLMLLCCLPMIAFVVLLTLGILR